MLMSILFYTSGCIIFTFQLDQYDNDFIKLYDGNSTEQDYLIRELVGLGYTPSDVQSVSHQMTVWFYTNRFQTSTGFKANILIQNEPINNACSVANPCNVNQGNCFYDGQCNGDLKCGEKNCPIELGYDSDSNCCYDYCSQWLNMTAGTLTSPNYPNWYENMITCSWRITSTADTVIKIVFNYFKVIIYHSMA